jgi:hypothetical protein
VASNVYAIIYGPAVKNKADKDSGDHEVLLSNVSSGGGGCKRFGGTCFCCKKKGHDTSDCECRSNPAATGTSSNAIQASGTKCS